MKAIPVDPFWLLYLRAIDRKLEAPSVKTKMAVNQFVMQAVEKRLASQALPKAIGQICDLYEDQALGVKAGHAVGSCNLNPFSLPVLLAPDAKDLGWAIKCILSTACVADLQLKAFAKDDRLQISFCYSVESSFATSKAFESCIEMPLTTLIECLSARAHIDSPLLTVTAPARRVDMLRENLDGNDISVLPGETGEYNVSMRVGSFDQPRYVNEWERLADELRLYAAPFGSQFELIESVARYLHHHPSPAAVRQSDVADELGLSVSALKRTFSDQQMVFKELSHKVIVARAAKELSTTDASVEDIADSLGYKDRSSMTKSFKAMVGQTPADYRRSHRYLHEMLVSDLLEFLEGAPPSDGAVIQLMKLREREDATFDDVAQVLSTDPLAAARVVSVASTAYYGVRIRSLNDAIARCHGVNGAIDLALFVSGVSRFKDTDLAVPSTTLFEIGRGANRIFEYMQETRGWECEIEPVARELALFFFPLGYYITLNNQFVSKEITDIWHKDPWKFGEVLFRELGVTTSQITHMVIASWGIFHPAVTSIQKLSVLIRPDIDGAWVPLVNALELSESAINGREVLSTAIQRMRHQGVKVSLDDAPQILRIISQV